MSRIVSLTIVVIGAVMLTACSGEGSATDEPATRSPSPQASPSVATTTAATETPSATTEASATPVGEAELVVDWAVPFTVTAPADWGLGEARTATAVEVVDGTGLRSVLAAYVKSPDAPDVWVERLTTHEAIDAAEPRSVEVDGAAGHVFDVRLNDAAPPCAAGGSSLGGTCIVIHGPEDGWVWVIEQGRPARIWVLDVEGETVMLSSDAREDRFEDWASTIDEVVSTLEWEQP